MSSPVAPADLRAYLGADLPDEDDMLQRLLDAAWTAMETWCNRSFASGTYAEMRDGANTDRIMLGQFPVTAVSSVTVDGAPLAAWSATQPVGYAFDEQSLLYIGGRFARGRRNVVVTYTAGYASMPADLVQANIEAAALKYRQKDNVGWSSKSLAGESISLVVTDFPSSVRSLLVNYRRVAPV